MKHSLQLRNRCMDGWRVEETSPRALTPLDTVRAEHSSVAVSTFSSASKCQAKFTHIHELTQSCQTVWTLRPERAVKTGKAVMNLSQVFSWCLIEVARCRKSRWHIESVLWGEGTKCKSKFKKIFRTDILQFKALNMISALYWKRREKGGGYQLIWYFMFNNCRRY